MLPKLSTRRGVMTDYITRFSALHLLLIKRKVQKFVIYGALWVAYELPNLFEICSVLIEFLPCGFSEDIVFGLEYLELVPIDKAIECFIIRMGVLDFFKAY